MITLLWFLKVLIVISLEQKVNYWRESAEERMEELRSVRLWVP